MRSELGLGTELVRSGLGVGEGMALECVRKALAMGTEWVKSG